MVQTSILEDVKKFCQVPEFDDGFDTELMILINSELMKISQITKDAQCGTYVTSAEETWPP